MATVLLFIYLVGLMALSVWWRVTCNHEQDAQRQWRYGKRKEGLTDLNTQLLRSSGSALVLSMMVWAVAVIGAVNAVVHIF